MDRLAKIKVTCSSARVREKLDILGEKHDQAVLDMQKTVSEVYQVVTEKEGQVANLAENVLMLHTFVLNKMEVPQRN